MAIRLQIDSTEAVDYVDRVRRRVLKALREGMAEAMQGLAAVAAANAPKKSGSLAAAILRSPKVTSTSKVIRGSVSGDVGAKHVALWQEQGINVPAVTNKLMVFVGSDGTPVFTRSHKAFRVAGRPFMNPALDTYQGQIIETLQKRMEEAAAG